MSASKKHMRAVTAGDSAPRSTSRRSASREPLNVVAEMRAGLAALLEVTNENAQPVARLLRQLDLVEVYVRRETHVPPPPEVHDTPPGFFKNYRIENRQGGAVLVEWWRGNKADPFRCGR